MIPASQVVFFFFFFFFFIETGIIWYTVIEIMCLVQNNPWVILVYFYIILLFSHYAILKQTISR